MKNNEDALLISKAQAGDRQAFEMLLSTHYDLMFRIAFKWCGNRSDAEDITQTACLKLAQALRSFRFQAAFTSWLYRMVINTAIDWKKANRQHLEWSDELSGSSAENPEAMAHTREILMRVLSLPERQKTALLLVFSEGLSHAEAAFAMQCKEATVSWYIHEARKTLAAAQKDEKEYRHG